MSFEDARQSWRSQVDRPLSPAEVRDGLATVQRRYAKLERAAHWRDLSEVLAAGAVIAAFAVMWPLYRHSYVATLGSAIIMLGGALVIVVLLSARKPVSLPFDASVRDFSCQRLVWLDTQIRLLGTVAWWYVAPAFVGSLLLLWGLVGRNLLIFGVLGLIDAAFAAGVIALNRRAIRRELLPVREDAARVVEALGSIEDN
jgi:hypothetical protein